MGIKFRNVSHLYKGINDSYLAIADVNLDIEDKDELICVCGKTGSGKSTLIQHMNALLLPTEGTINIFEKEIIANKKIKKLNSIRQRVGLVFQFPEYQLFEETVLKDIIFGPTNFGVKKNDAIKKAMELADILGIEDILEKSPFHLSGGQMRKVAIAGILAMEPDILILDEPTRGLDPQGRRDILELLEKINNEMHKTIIIITHDMELVSEYSKRVIVMKDGKKVFDGSKKELFYNEDFNNFHLDLPYAIKSKKYLEENMNIKLSSDIFTAEDLINELEKM